MIVFAELLASTLLYFDIENPVLWAGSETMGCVANLSSGMMEHWNVGIPGLAECDLILIRMERIRK